MKTEHTPGPWRVEVNETSIQLDIFNDNFSEHIASVNCLDDSTKSFDTAKADADLIAAAPELLQALKTLCNSMGNIHAIVWAYNNAQSKISKTNGE